MEELDNYKVVTSGTSGKPSSLQHTDALWVLQSPTSVADWLSRLQKKKELEKYVCSEIVYVATCRYFISLPTYVHLCFAYLSQYSVVI